MHDREAMLVEFSQQFKTQGNRDGQYWFIGIEEGGGATEKEVDSMLDKWDRDGRCDVAMLHDPESDKVTCKWFDTSRVGDPPIQKTWGAQIRILLSMLGISADREKVRQYQANQFGTPKGETCLMEMLPLPNPGINRWIYSELSDLPQFVSRDAFSAHSVDARIDRFRELVLLHQPTSVVLSLIHI